jgi:hypothetical protein
MYHRTLIYISITSNDLSELDFTQNTNFYVQQLYLANS